MKIYNYAGNVSLSSASFVLAGGVGWGGGGVGSKLLQSIEM